MNVAELSAREAIRDLVTRYNSNGDSGRFEEVALLFAPDGVLELPDGSSHQGPDAVLSAFVAVRDRAFPEGRSRHVHHLVATHQIDLHDDGHASGRAYYQVLTAVGVDHWGRYVDRYRVVDGRWRLAHRRVTVDGSHPASLMIRPDNGDLPSTASSHPAAARRERQ